jgi:hypothetical protein
MSSMMARHRYDAAARSSLSIAAVTIIALHLNFSDIAIVGPGRRGVVR